jgi:alkylation response protein AidB-like acyl-CoA dehydrogenase
VTTDSTDIDALVAEAERFLRTTLPPSWVEAIDRDDADALAAARGELDLDMWWEELADARFSVPTWPVEFGGRSLGPAAATAVRRTMSRYKVPRNPNPVGVGQVGPALLEHGTDEQRRTLLERIARNEDIWCQLFSEPGAGSDLASLSTRAELVDGEWMVHGQKVWTSVAQEASLGLLLARTEPELPKHKGITAFLLPMRQPGVTVRPLKDISGDAAFNEVFLDGAVVADSMRLGEVNGGWLIAVSVLTGERHSLGGGDGSSPTIAGRSVDALVRRHAPVADEHLRHRLVQAYVEQRLLHQTNQRAAARRRAGGASGPEGSISKLFNSEHMQRVQDLAVDLEGCGGQAWLDGDRWRRGTAWSFLWVRSRTIAGGTSEVQRNILGERALGLPKEPQADRDVPWSQTRRS